jgi:hypothetical protein
LPESVPRSSAPVPQSRLARIEPRELLVAGLHLAVLWSFAVAQPLLDLLGETPEFFVARQNGRADILVLAFALVLAAPLLLLGLEVLASLVSPALRRGLHLVLIGLLVAAFVLQLLKDGPGGSGAVLIPVATAAGALAALAYARTRAAPALLSVLSPAPLVFLAIFLLVSPVSKLVVRGAEVEVSSAAANARTPVVMIVFDELSTIALLGHDGHVDAARFPNFARLARDADWYRNATTVADNTATAVPAILTGERPRPGDAPIASSHPENLFTLLGGRYLLDVREPATDLCPERLCSGESAGRESLGRRLQRLWSDLRYVSLHLLLPEDVADGLPPVDRSFGDFRRFGAQEDDDDPGAEERGFAAVAAFGRRVQEMQEFARRLGRPPEDARLSFLHVFYPHQPYTFLPTGQRYPNTQGLPGLESGEAAAGTWRRDPRLARQALQRYVLQVEYGDRLLGEAMARMRASGLYERALVVVVADHGVSFKPGTPIRDVRDANVAQIANVPLFVKGAHQRRGRLIDTNVTTVDVLPTIASRLGIRLPWTIDGRPADRARGGGTVTIKPEHSEGSVSLRFADYVRRRDAASRALLADLGEGGDALYGGPTDDDLVGQRVAALRASNSRARFELDADGLFVSVEPRGAVVPSLVTGKVTGVPTGARLAVALNGRVAAVTAAYADEDDKRFSALVPPTAFAKGANDIDLIAVTGRGAGRRLARLQGGADAGVYRIVRAGARPTLVDAAGDRIAVAPSSLEGSVDQVTSSEADLTVLGWAGTTRPPRPADRVVVFAGDRFVSSGRPTLPRSDLSDKFGSGLGRAGFKVVGPVSDPRPGSRRAPLRVFAILGRRAALISPPSARNGPAALAAP